LQPNQLPNYKNVFEYDGAVPVSDPTTKTSSTSGNDFINYQINIAQ
jgi:hypothetical protein